MSRSTEDMFDYARGLGPEDRARYLDQVGAEDPARRAEVESLLHHDEESAIWDARVADIITIHQGDDFPRHIAGYRILDLLGRGGMGVVYLAEQRSTSQQVALKVLSRFLESDSARRRFGREIRILAQLHHVGIARIFDAGIHESDVGPAPYFAMEWVDGCTLTEFVASHHSTRNERIDLVIAICQAVDHAHVHGIVHRDLKPTNILVQEDGQPKLVDFGIARALAGDLTESLTAPGMPIGTLDAMSPEQARGEPVDERSDIYSLGVLMYELLAGVKPYEVDHRFEAARVICEEEPRSLTDVDPSIGRDLAAVTAKALEKDPNRRYGSARELCLDLMRYRRGEPVLARTPSLRYRVRKFTGRHRRLVAVAVTVVLVLSGALALAIRSSGREHQRANELARAMSVFERVFVPESAGYDLRYVDFIHEARPKLESLRSIPEMFARVSLSVSKTFRFLDEYETAKSILGDALSNLPASQRNSDLGIQDSN